MRNVMHQSVIVLVRCVPGSSTDDHRRGEGPGDEVASYADALWARHAILRDEPKERLRRRLSHYARSH